MWVLISIGTIQWFNLPSPVTSDTYEPLWESVSGAADTQPMLTITPVPLPDALIVEGDAVEIYAEPAIAVAPTINMVYPVEPYPIKALPTPPPFPMELGMIDLPYYGWGSEMESYFYQFCESSTDEYACSRYGDIVLRLSPKVQELAILIQNSFDEDKQEDIKWMIRNIIEQKFYEVSTEKSKFTISYVWIALQEYLYEEDVEDIGSRLWDAITNLQNNWKIVSISEAPGDMTRVQWDTVTSSNNRFGLELDAQFESGRAVTPEQWYEVLAYFGDKSPYFVDREDMRYAQYDNDSKIWKFDGDQDMYRMWGKVPESDSVTIYLLCQYCDGEEFHPDRDNQSIADSRTFVFEKIDDNLSYDIALDVQEYIITPQSESTMIQLEYTLTNVWVQEVAGMRSNVWAYPMRDGPRYGDDSDPDRTITSVMCASQEISEDDFLDGNIVLGSGESCIVSEQVMITNRGSNDIELSVEIEARMDQYRDNNGRNELIEL